MISIDEIKKQYSVEFHKFDRGLLREYLQYQILGIIFSHKLGSKLSFLGGTCLRIAHKLNRFSEDIDFDNKNITFEEFQEIGDHLKKGLERRGFEVEIRFVNKLAFHCYVRFPRLLYEQGISPLEGEKILVQIDTFNQGVDYEAEVFILDKFELFTPIRVTPKSVILSQKLWTINQRKTLKGRDFFDIMFLLQNTTPDLAFLEVKFGTNDLTEVKKIINQKLSGVDFDRLAEDVRPFLLNAEDSSSIKHFRAFIEQKL